MPEAQSFRKYTTVETTRIFFFCGVDSSAASTVIWPWFAVLILPTLEPLSFANFSAEALAFSQDLVRDSIMGIYKMDAYEADCYYRNLWLIAFSFCAMIAAGECPYTDEQMSAMFTEVSLAVCKAYKDIPGLPRGDYDRDAIFRELTK